MDSTSESVISLVALVAYAAFEWWLFRQKAPRKVEPPKPTRWSWEYSMSLGPVVEDNSVYSSPVFWMVLVFIGMMIGVAWHG